MSAAQLRPVLSLASLAIGLLGILPVSAQTAAQPAIAQPAASAASAASAAAALPPLNELPPEALAPLLEQIFDKPKDEADASTLRPLVLAPGFASLASAQAYGRPLSIRSREQARAEQLAWFVYLSRAEGGPELIKLSYSTPYNGRYGTATLVKGAEGWTLQEHQKMHSSSGARFFYGELYDGAACRDGGEMARRWQYYLDAVQAMQARRPRTAFEALPTACPGKEFPDVAAWRQQKLLMDMIRKKE